MKRMLLFLLALLALKSHGLNSTQEQDALLKKLCAYAGAKTFLLSYPRSGNTWMRYCLEYLTARPTFHKFNLTDIRNQPIGWKAEFFVDCSRNPIEKVHRRKELPERSAYNREDKLIVLVRNPKEVLSRHGKEQITPAVLQGEHAKGNADPRIYFDNIALFDAWPIHMRLLIYYEDFITKPIQILAEVLRFLDEPLQNIDLFIKDYTVHKKKAISLYRESETHGDDILYHSKKIDPAYRKKIDEWLSQLYPLSWERYLHARYAEEYLTY